MMTGRLIIVSNRLPYKLERRGQNIEIKKSSGGLVSALDSSLTGDRTVLWVGAADFSPEIWKSYMRQPQENLQYGISPLFLNSRIEKKYYHGFSNTTIWPLFHYFPSFAEYREEQYEAYREVNELFAAHLSEIIQPDDIVWVHDYHLMLLPGLLKQKSRGIGIGFFLHIPFPNYEILKLIPEKWRNDILCSLVQSDVVGFHTREYVGHFKHSLSYFLGIDFSSEHHAQFRDNSVLIKEYPISIDYQKFNNAYTYRAVVAARRQIQVRHRHQKIIFSVDRLDYTKGVLNRLQAYEELLNERTELRQKVVFIINVVPSREKHAKYAERRKMIEEQVSHINGIYGNMYWQPILYQYNHLTFNQLVAFYSGCDVALVTPLRDGMNLVAKEFVATRKDKQGALILSEFAGAATELSGAILVNPNDITLMKEAMMKALELPAEEQRERIERMQSVIETNDVRKWTNDFLTDLRTNRNMNINSKVRIMTYDERLEIFERYRKSAKRLILLDYDGTLSPFYDVPSDASPENKTLQMLSALASNDRNKVVIISGRDKNTLEQWFGHLPVELVAEHGGFHRPTDSAGWLGNDDGSEGWKSSVREIFTQYTNEIPGSFIEEKNHGVTWHYRKCKGINEDEVVQRVMRDLMISNPVNRFNVMNGNKIVEVKNASYNKGAIASQLLQGDKYDFVLAIGDDVTDEDMFSRLNGKNHYTVKVGLTSTTAMYNLIGVSNVFSFLEQLTVFRNPPVLSKTAGELALEKAAETEKAHQD